MAANAKVGQAKEKDFDSIMPRYEFCDMPDETKNMVIDTCREACKMQHDNELKYFKDMAGHIKKQLDTQLGGSWHIIVGKLQIISKIVCRSFGFELHY